MDFRKTAGIMMAFTVVVIVYTAVYSWEFVLIGTISESWFVKNSVTVHIYLICALIFCPPVFWFFIKTFDRFDKKFDSLEAYQNTVKLNPSLQIFGVISGLYGVFLILVMIFWAYFIIDDFSYRSWQLALWVLSLFPVFCVNYYVYTTYMLLKQQVKEVPDDILDLNLPSAD